MTTQYGKTGNLNTKQFKLWCDILASDGWLDMDKLASTHNYTKREVSTAIRRMDSDLIEVDSSGYVRFTGSEEERRAYRCDLTARRYKITEDMCDAVSRAVEDEWLTATSIAEMTGIPTISVSRTLVVLGGSVTCRSCSSGKFYRRAGAGD